MSKGSGWSRSNVEPLLTCGLLTPISRAFFPSLLAANQCGREFFSSRLAANKCGRGFFSLRLAASQCGRGSGVIEPQVLQKTQPGPTVESPQNKWSPRERATERSILSAANRLRDSCSTMDGRASPTALRCGKPQKKRIPDRTGLRQAADLCP